MPHSDKSRNPMSLRRTVFPHLHRASGSLKNSTNAVGHNRSSSDTGSPEFNIVARNVQSRGGTYNSRIFEATHAQLSDWVSSPMPTIRRQSSQAYVRRPGWYSTK